MVLLRFYNFSRLSCLFALMLIFPLVSCSSSGDDANASMPDQVPDQVYEISLSLSWLATLEREDGTGMWPEEIAGYRIYYGTVAGYYPNQFVVNDGSVTQAQISGVTPGTYYAVVTTVDSDGFESRYSSEVVVTAVMEA